MIVLVAPSSSFLFLLKTVLSAIITVFALRFSPNKKALKEKNGRKEKKRAFGRLTKKKKEKNENGRQVDMRNSDKEDIDALS